MTKKQVIALIIRAETVTDQPETRPGPVAQRSPGDRRFTLPLHMVAEGDAPLIWPK